MFKCDKERCFGNKRGQCHVLAMGFDGDCPFFKDEKKVLQEKLRKVKDGLTYQDKVQKERLKSKADRDLENHGIIRVNGGVQYVGLNKDKK